VSHISDIMSDFKKMTDSDSTDLEKLYKKLDIHVDTIPRKETFSPEVANSKHDPTDFNKETDASLVKMEERNKTNKKNKDEHYNYAYILEKYKEDKDQNLKTASAGEDDVPHWSKLTHLYIGSLTIIGLYAVFRALQKS